MSLSEYIRKRDFKRTAEPRGGRGRNAARSFVIQKHDATRLHYDLRLKLGGTLKSWALPKGMPYAHAEKRLAVQVEDHPLDYAHFEGSIPKGQYGGGTVMIWDQGTYVPLSRSPLKDLESGKLHFVLNGEKVQGEWYLVRMRGEENQWLIIRGGETMKPPSKRRDDWSVVSHKTMAQLAAEESLKRQPSKKGARTSKKRVVRKSPSLPDFVEPMKARLAATAPAGDWLYEIKFDGWRAIALKAGDGAQLLSRNKKDLGGKFPELLEEVAKLDSEDFVIDGEIVALDSKGLSSFQLLQAYDKGLEKPELYYYAFDLLSLDGRSLIRLAIERRKALLEKLLAKSSGVIRYSADLKGDVQKLLEKARALGVEGLIGKKAGSVYEVGKRSGSWIKLKFVREQEFVIGGYWEPKGSRKYFGSLIVGYYKGKDLVFAARVGTGFNATLLRSIFRQLQERLIPRCPFVDLPVPRGEQGRYSITRADMKFCHWVEPELVCQVKFSEWTRDGHLRQPVFIGMRDDKNARDVIRERGN